MRTQAIFDIGNVFLEPWSTFSRLKARTNAWLPLLVLILLSLGIMYWWIATLDMAWLREHMLAAQPGAKPEMRAAMERSLTPRTMMWFSGIGAAGGTLLICALAALYYLAAGRMLGAALVQIIG